MIKFRAWDKKTKEYFHISELWNSGTNPECFDFDGWTDNFGNKGRLKDIAIEQFTGLKDVNGNEIYENDIIVSRPTEPILGSPKIGVVKLSKVSFSWCYETGNNEYNIWKTDKYRTYEVIGNVHANPELLVE
ncbi:YopX family protein [Lactiplantibacillus plantarum]|uniref:YopX family protein n=1 Tax=Lactiplantibacillus plantarum TaxID=1590 RepID=UPI0022380D25|nr:YopX family protein [Lactiplantibacillus plantarum]MCW6126924.1 YopX family protein [Lactiplantibacillus plantarum]